MRIAGKILRWGLVFVGLIEILFNVGNLVANGDRSKGEAVAATLVWVVIITIVMYLERRSNKKRGK